MVSLNLPVPDLTADWGVAAPGADWASLIVAAFNALNSGKVEIGGDLGGTYLAPTVAKIAGCTLSGTPGTPSSSVFLRGDGTWATPAGGGGGVSSVTAGDSTIVIGGTGTAPTVKANVGTGAGSVAAGNDSRFAGSAAGTAGAALSATDASTTNSRTPTGTAGGDLGGTYPNPSVAKVAGATISGTPGTPSSSNFLRGDGTWAVPSGGGGGYTSPTPVSAEYLFNAVLGGAANVATAMTSGTLYAVPFYNTGAAFNVDRIAVNIGTAGAAGAVIRLGAYSVVNGKIGSLLWDAGTVAATATGDQNITIAQSIPGNAVTLLVAVCNDSTIKPRWIGSSPSLNPLWWRGVAGPVNNGGRFLTYTGYTATSALPSTGSTTGEAIQSGDTLMIAVRAA